MLMQNRMRTYLASILTLVLSATAFGDEVTLKTGKVVKGFIVEDGPKSVRIETPEGKTERFRREDVESVAESSQIGSEELDKQLGEVDGEDPSALAELAKKAKDNGTKGWRLVARLALRKEPNHDLAHELLDHIKVGDTWYTNKTDADKANKELMAKKFAEEGYVRYKDGWIKKEDKALADKDPKAFTRDDNGLFRETSEVMKEKGLVFLGGKWIQGGTEEDRRDMAKFKELMGEDIWIHTTKHFRLYMQQYPPDKVAEFGKLLETVYDWFVKEMGKEPAHDVFRGNRGHMWVLKDKNAVMKWFANYRNRFSLDDQFKTLLDQGGGNVHADGILIATQVPNQSSDIRNQLVHVAGHFLIFWFSPGLKHASWLSEAFGHHAEHVHLGSGVVNCSTLANYDADGGKAQKEFATKDAKDRAKGLVRNGSDEAFGILDKLDLNALNGDHLTKGWTLVDWLLREHHDAFVKWLEARNRATTEDSVTQALNGWSLEALDDEWRKYVKSKF
jgi:hypothetical protein